MRILVVSESPLQRRGNEFYAVDPWIRFIQHLAQTAAGVTLIAPVRAVTEPTADAWRLELGRLAIQPLEFYESYAGFARLWWRRRGFWFRLFADLAAKHDVVAIRLPSPALGLVMRAAKRAGKPAALLIAGDMRAQSDRLIDSRGIRRFVYGLVIDALVRREVSWGRRAAAVFAYSSELAERHFGSRVIAMRTPHLTMADIHPRADACEGAEIRLLRVSWLIPSKGIETLIDAVARLAKNDERFIRLRVVGKERMFGYQSFLERRAAELGISDRVTFEGWVPFDRMGSVYAESDMQVISSVAEGTPRCMVEGMARGVPLVSTNVGGCRDVLTDGETALLVEPNDAVAMAGAIERVIADRELRCRMIAGGYEMARAATFEVRGAAFLKSLSEISGETV